MIESKSDFLDDWEGAENDAAEIAESHGFGQVPEHIPTALCLMHAEISEALEAHRAGNPPDSHIPEFSGLEAELADVIIRILHFSHYHKLRLLSAVQAKMEYNRDRPFLHGKKY